jgi:hypothetical protein
MFSALRHWGFFPPNISISGAVCFQCQKVPDCQEKICFGFAKEYDIAKREVKITDEI